MKYTLFIFLAISFVFGADDNFVPPSTFTSPSPQEQAQNQGQPPMDLRIKKFFLNISPKQAHEVIKKDKDMKELLDRFDDVIINSKPELRPIASQDSIMVHPYFTTTILLPTGSEISYVDSSADFEVLKFDQNSIMYRPKKDFEVANLSILYSLNNQNRVLNLIVRRYEKNKDNQLNLVYSYRDIPKLSPMQVMATYFMENGKYPDSKYEYIYIDGIYYRIVEDEKYGTINIKGKKYRVDNQKVYQ